MSNFKPLKKSLKKDEGKLVQSKSLLGKNGSKILVDTVRFSGKAKPGR